jgi:hypothetical protein
LPATTAILTNNQIGKYLSRENATVLKNVFTATANGFGRAFYQPREFTVAQDSYAFTFKDKNIKIEKIHYFILSSLNKVYGRYNWGNKSGWNKVKKEKIKLPTTDGKIDFTFMENFVAELEALHVAELEALHVAELEAYLTVTGLKDYNLTKEEEEALNDFDKLNWKEFNVKKLFGSSTRGKRLKSADRVPGALPFVTAGEAEEGVSAFIGNDVKIFNSNTTTIDMFGSAKYRNYKYGGDDHIAVVHTEKLEKHAAIFVTSAIHKSSYNGQFSYDKNFYAKDADALSIKLPVKENGKPDYEYMAILIKAMHKKVIKDVVLFSDAKTSATKKIIAK